MFINHNIRALNSYRNNNINNKSKNKSMEKLASGSRINRAGDDAANLGISEKMKGQIRGLDQAANNTSDGISLIQTAEGALEETTSILQRMRELAVQAANDTNTQEDRSAIQEEIKQLTKEIDRIANDTEFNGKKLLNGSQEINGAAPPGTGQLGVFELTLGRTVMDKDVLYIEGVSIVFSDYTAKNLQSTLAVTFTEYDVKVSGLKITFTQKVPSDKSGLIVYANPDKDGQGVEQSLVCNTLVEGKNGTINNNPQQPQGDGITLQIGANSGQSVQFKISDMRAEALNITKKDGTCLDLLTANDANNAIEAFDNAINKVSDERTNLGAIQNRLEHTIYNLGNMSENLTSSESTIRDTNMAKEMFEFSRSGILSEAAQAMLAQANQHPQNLLKLLS